MRVGSDFERYINATSAAIPNEKDLQILKQLYGNKRYLQFTASGTSALQLALASLGVGTGAQVLVPTHCCYLVGAAVKSCGAKVQFVEVGDDLALKPEHIPAGALTSCDAIIAVHSYGLPCDISQLRNYAGSAIPIIEDASLAFNLQYSGHSVGSHSDLVVTSLRSGKPLSLEEGGIVFSDTEQPALLSGRHCRSRESGQIPLAYPLNPLALRYLPHALSSAHERLRERAELALNIQSQLGRYGIETWTPKQEDRPAWHRLPIFFLNRQERDQFIDRSQGILQPPHQISVDSLPMFQGEPEIIDQHVEQNPGLAFLRLQSAERVGEFLKGLPEVVGQVLV